VSVFSALLLRDLGQMFGGGRRGATLLPVLFFIAVAMLYPFAVGPAPELLARDVERGFFDQLALRGIAEELVVAVRLLAHWLSFGPPLMLATLPAAALLGLDAAALRTVELGLLAGTPGLAAIGLMIAALTIGVRGGAALSGLLLIPLAIPLLVFGAGALATDGQGGIALTGAVSLLLTALTPVAGGAAIRAAREG
jgi:heme exporter protein B